MLLKIMLIEAMIVVGIAAALMIGLAVPMIREERKERRRKR